MKRLTPDSPELKSADLVEENIERLRELFPEAFANEGKIDFDVLRQLLGDRVDDGEERYGLNWHGKRAARQLALTPSTGTLRPCPEESVDWDTTQNIFIEGDNLEVLKLLQKSYAGKVKLIYIDPPYNTGKDFVYPDNFQDSIKHYLEITGQIEGGQRITSNTEASGRFHTDWLNMMYPRLKLAKSLLQPDGVMFISIDDGELAGLGFALEDIFGADAFIGRFIWRKKYTLSFRDEHMIPVHEYIYAFKGTGRVALVDPRWKEESTVAVNPVFKSQNPRSRKTIRSGARLRGGRSLTLPKGTYPLPSQELQLHDDAVFRDGVLCQDISITAGFAVGQDTLDTAVIEMSESGAAYVVSEGEESSIKPISILFDYTKDDKEFLYAQYLARKAISTRQATAELEGIMEAKVFDNPKPSLLIEYLVSLVNPSAGDIVLDFFAGSGTSAHSVLRYSNDHKARLRFILIQLPEALANETQSETAARALCAKLGVSPTIAEVAKERLRRVGKLILPSEAMSKHDCGFRVFKLDSGNVCAWEARKETLAESLAAAVDHVKPDRTEDDLLYDIILKHGLDLCAPIDVKKIGDHTVRSVGGGAVFACVGSTIRAADVEPLAAGIAAWRDELGPANPELSRVVFRDSAFETDVAKTNLALILKERGFDEKLVVSL